MEITETWKMWSKSNHMLFYSFMIRSLSQKCDRIRIYSSTFPIINMVTEHTQRWSIDAQRWCHVRCICLTFLHCAFSSSFLNDGFPYLADNKYGQGTHPAVLYQCSTPMEKDTTNYGRLTWRSFSTPGLYGGENYISKIRN